MKCNYTALNGNRSKLELYLLKSLAKKEHFQNYLTYFIDPKSAVKEFIKECIEDYMKKTHKMSGFLLTNVDEFKNIIEKAIDLSTGKMKKEKGNVDLWLDTFCSELGNKLNLSRNDLKSVKHQNITEIDFLKEAITKAMKTVVQMCQEEMSTCDKDSLQKRIFGILTDDNQGCWEQCPFCGAACTNTDPKHSHSAQLHRPTGFNGRCTWWFGKKLRVDMCTSLVGSKAWFTSRNSRTPTFYSNYAKEGKPFSDWSITPHNSSSSYWKWVTCRFQSDIEKWHDKKFEPIPYQWEKISRDDAISEIEKRLERK